MRLRWIQSNSVLYFLLSATAWHVMHAMAYVGLVRGRSRTTIHGGA